MKKILVMMGFIILFSGCTVNYNISFKYDNSIDEDVKISVLNKDIEDAGYTIKEAVNGSLESYKDILYQNDFNSSTEYNNNNVVVTLESKNKTVEKFTKLLYFQRMFNGADVEETKDYYSFKTNGIYNQSGLFYDPYGIADDGFVDQININIKFENKVVSNNADNFDNSTNTGTWILDKNTVNKTIEFKIEKDKSKQKSSKRGNIKSSKGFMKTLIIFGIIIIIIVLLYAVGLNKNRNKI